MFLEQELWTGEGEVQTVRSDGACTNPQWVLALGSPSRVRAKETWERLRARWPAAHLVVASTAGEICATRVVDGALVATAMQFEKAAVRCVRVDLDDSGSSEELGRRLAEGLSSGGLRHVFVLSDGLKVNGSALVRGLRAALPAEVSITGGLAGDGPRFEQTHVCLDAFREGPSVVGVGLYGPSLRVGVGSLGGWDPFGPERRITRSEGNVLYELDGRPALALYEQYLGEHAAGLPASGLLFPLTVRAGREDEAVVRTILAVDRVKGTLTFAGDVPCGHYARLMRANFDRLVDGASGAAKSSRAALGEGPPALAILISCVGRKLVLKQRVEEEVEAAERVLGPGALMTGFYSYGEISPFTPTAPCELHNQTMTITTFAEA